VLWSIAFWLGHLRRRVEKRHGQAPLALRWFSLQRQLKAFHRFSGHLPCAQLATNAAPAALIGPELYSEINSEAVAAELQRSKEQLD